MITVTASDIRSCLEAYDNHRPESAFWASKSGRDAMDVSDWLDDEADKIVRAYQSHDALVAALRMVYEMERDRQKWSDTVQPVWVRHAETALATAEGES